MAGGKHGKLLDPGSRAPEFRLPRLDGGTAARYHPAAVAADVALCSEFTDREALERYQNHPEHLVAADFVGSVRETRQVVDFET